MTRDIETLKRKRRELLDEVERLSRRIDAIERANAKQVQYVHKHKPGDLGPMFDPAEEVPHAE